MRRFRAHTQIIAFRQNIGISHLWLWAALYCWFSHGCALSQLPRDLAVYLNRDIYAIAELESIALNCYAEQTGDNYVSDQLLRASLDEKIIPVYERFSILAGRIKPQTKPVKELHSLYRKAAAIRLQGFRTVLLAIDTQDTSLIRQANRMLEQGQYYVTQWRVEMVDLAKLHGLKLDDMTDGNAWHDAWFLN